MLCIERVDIVCPSRRVFQKRAIFSRVLEPMLTEIEHRVAMTEVARFRDSVEVEGVRTVRGTEAVTRIGVSFPCRQHRGMDEQRKIGRASCRERVCQYV